MPGVRARRIEQASGAVGGGVRQAPTGPTPAGITTEERARILSLIATRQSDVARWSTAPPARMAWDHRARWAARLIRPGSRVLDLGCGTMSLRQFLPEGCTYIPADIVKRSEDTHLIELNQGIWPAVTADVVVALGVLEYVYDVQAFMAGVRRCGPELVFTYNVRAALGPANAEARLRMGWLTDFALSEILAAMEAADGSLLRLTTAGAKRAFIPYLGQIAFPPAAD